MVKKLIAAIRKNESEIRALQKKERGLVVRAKALIRKSRKRR